MAMDAYIQERNLEVEVRFDIMSYLCQKGAWQFKYLSRVFYVF